MDRESLINLVQTPDRAAKEMGYAIDWSSSESVRESINNMDLLSSVVVKSCIEHTAWILGSITKEEPEQAGITIENLLQVASGINHNEDASSSHGT